MYNDGLTYLLTPRSRAVLEKLTGLQLVKKFPTFYGNPMVHYRIHNFPQTDPILSKLDPVHFLNIHLNIIFPYTPLVSQVAYFPQVSPPKTLYTKLLPPIRSTCTAKLILLDFITRTIFGDQYGSLSSSL
jgi:hypothetical protein